MIGFNKDEGYIFANITTFLVPPHQPVDDGYTMNYTRRILKEGLCPLITPLSIELCVDYLINLYDFESIVSDEERARAVADSRSEYSELMKNKLFINKEIIFPWAYSMYMYEYILTTTDACTRAYSDRQCICVAMGIVRKQYPYPSEMLHDQ